MTTTRQKTHSRVEKTIQDLRTLMDNQVFKDNRLPSEPELARRFGASRATVRQALTKLEREGLVLRKHGVGTFINERILNIGTRLEEVWDFSEMIRLSGYRPGVQHQSLSLLPANANTAKQLTLNPGEEVLKTENVFTADRTPVIFCIDIIPARFVRSAYNDEELHGPVYTFLEERCYQQVAYNIAEIQAVIADTQLSELLACPLGSPLHYMEEVAYNADDIPVMCSEEYYLPAFFSFNVVRKMRTQALSPS